MKILVGQYHMNSIGGTEMFTYTLVKELVKQGHEVNLITAIPGILSKLLKTECGVETNELKRQYDIALVNHNVMVDKIRELRINTRIIQTCHGTVPPLEKPSQNADRIVCISQEIADSINKPSTIIYNGIDCETFKSIKPLNDKPKKILSLTQSDLAHDLIKDACKIIGCEYIVADKNNNPHLTIQHAINDVDLVIGLGRSAYDAIACGRPVFIWDWRHYMTNKGDGYLTKDNINELVKFNCSGRRYNKEYTAELLAKEIMENYKKSDGDEMRELALDKFNMTKNVKKYLEL